MQAPTNTPTKFTSPAAPLTPHTQTSHGTTNPSCPSPTSTPCYSLIDPAAEDLLISLPPQLETACNDVELQDVDNRDHNLPLHRHCLQQQPIALDQLRLANPAQRRPLTNAADNHHPTTRQFLSSHHAPSTPNSAARTQISTELPPLCITVDNLAAVLCRLRRGTAPRMTGWTYEHIID
jgi:hypothetical protein